MGNDLGVDVCCWPDQLASRIIHASKVSYCHRAYNGAMAEKRMLVVPYLDLFDTGGGMITSLRRQLKNLSALGWSGVVVSELSDKSHLESRKFHNFDVDYAKPITERWVPLKNPLKVLSFWMKSISRMTLIAKSLREKGIELIYITGPPNFPVTGTPNMFKYWMLLKKFRGIKVVIGVRGAGSSWVPNPAMAKIFFMEEVSQLKSADRFTCVDHFILHDHYPEELREKGVIITNTVETDIFHPMPEKADGRCAMFVGHLTAERGIWEFLEAAKILSERGRDYRFVIVGKGALEAKARRFIKENGLNAELRGAVPYEKMCPVYNEAAVVVNPTPMEGIGNITLEAMACGRCVIRTKSKFREYVIDHGNNGLLHERDSPEDLAEQIEFAMEHPAEREKMGKAARELVLMEYTENVETEKYDRLLSGLLEPQP